VLAKAPADVLPGFETFRALSTMISSAAAGRSLTINATDCLVDLEAVASPPRRPHEPPSLTESELPRAGGDTPPTLACAMLSRILPFDSVSASILPRGRGGRSRTLLSTRCRKAKAPRLHARSKSRLTKTPMTSSFVWASLERKQTREP
jgi:hypothetical protein